LPSNLGLQQTRIIALLARCYEGPFAFELSVRTLLTLTSFSIWSLITPQLAAKGQVAREQTAKEQATIRTTTQLVQVLLVATDDHGHPYRLLQPSDIKIWDAGQQRSIKMFKLADEDQPRHYEPLPKLGSYSNVRASGKSKLFNAVLLDQVHTDANSWQKASHELKQVITALAADDDVGIYLWTPHGLTLVRQRPSSQEGTTLRLKHSDAQRRSSSFAERSGTLQTPERIEEWQGQRLSSVLEAISHDLASLPGRRVLT
jgi:hypothetical protein